MERRATSNNTTNASLKIHPNSKINGPLVHAQTCGSMTDICTKIATDFLMLSD